MRGSREVVLGKTGKVWNLAGLDGVSVCFYQVLIESTQSSSQRITIPLSPVPSTLYTINPIKTKYVMTGRSCKRDVQCTAHQSRLNELPHIIILSWIFPIFLSPLHHNRHPYTRVHTSTDYGHKSNLHNPGHSPLVVDQGHHFPSDRHAPKPIQHQRETIFIIIILPGFIGKRLPFLLLLLIHTIQLSCHRHWLSLFLADCFSGRLATTPISSTLAPTQCGLVPILDCGVLGRVTDGTQLCKVQEGHLKPQTGEHLHAPFRASSCPCCLPFNPLKRLFTTV